jgi:hypothetical protein
MWMNLTTGKVFTLHCDIRTEHCEVMLPNTLDDALIESLGYVPVTPVLPAYNWVTHRAVEASPVLIDGAWVQQWEYVQLPAEEIANNKARYMLLKGPLAPTLPPPCNQVTHYHRELLPELNSDVWEQRWEIVERTPDELVARKADLVEQLWRSADTHVTKFISGVAIGLLTLGCIQQKPKALAVSAWSSSIWDAYYVAKEQVSNNTFPSVIFSTFGPMPYSVPELRAELGM